MAHVEQALRRSGLLDQATAVAVTFPATRAVAWSAGHLPSGLPVRAGTPMYAASIAKQVVATLSAQAVVAGALDVDTSLRDVIPTLPAWTAPVRVRHLIHHTSGLPATGRVLAAAGLEAEHELDNRAVLIGVRRSQGPDGPPGRAFSYSNMGYVCLAEIVRAVSGSDLGRLARQSIFDPLGMTNTHLGGTADVTLPGLPPPPRTVGDGGLWVSAADLLRWLDALNEERLGHDVTRLVQTPGRLDDGTPLPYAWGMTVRPHAAGTTYTHGGNWPGWSAKAVRRPSTRTSVALLSRCDDVQLVSDTALTIARLLVPTVRRAGADPPRQVRGR